MLLLIGFAFLAGVVTILSPCILPLLPIILSSSVSGGKKRPLGVVLGFVASFTFFTIFLATLVQLTGLPADALRSLAALVILIFGLVLVIPQLQAAWEKLAAKFLSSRTVNTSRSGFIGGLIVGVSLGLIWAPCVGPIMAAVITLAATGEVGLTTVLVAFSYSIGTAIPMLGIIYGSRYLLSSMPFLKSKAKLIQQIFGILMIITAIAIYFNWDRKFQVYILDTFPQYGAGLTTFEDNQLINDQLDTLTGVETSSTSDQETNPAPELVGYTKWLNTEPLTLEELRGKVVLVDFWTYSCINCIRTLPYLTAWHDQYADQGLVIIGVHAPEFAFEKVEANVLEAMEDFGIEYPVVQDNDFNIWKAYKNRYWPAKYLIDHQGNIRYTHFGEGKYQETEDTIRQLLQEAGAQPESENVDITSVQRESRTPETYLGYWRMEGFASPQGIQEDQIINYTFPFTLSVDKFAFEGNWQIAYQHAQPDQGSKLRFHIKAQDIHLVMSPLQGTPRVRLMLDGQPLDETNQGDDVVNSIVALDKDRLYNLVRLPQSEEHILEIEFLDGQIQTFAFTFG